MAVDAYDDDAGAMLPPPPRRGGGAGGGSARPLSNDDFRRMVMDTPRRGEGEKKTQQQKKSSGQKKDDEDGPKKPKWKKPKPKPGTEEDEENPLSSSYRDRAKERREEKNPDYVGMDLEINTFSAVAPPTDYIDPAQVQKMSIENSKYLGGDLEHTHLVKGLDFALLQKIRSEMHKEEAEGVSREVKEDKVTPDQPVRFQTAMGKVVWQHLLAPPKTRPVNEMFLPGRTAYVFDMEEDAGHDIPTTVHRSKTDCPAPEDRITAGIDAAVLDRLAKIMSYLRMGSGKGKKLRKKEKAINGVASQSDVVRANLQSLASSSKAEASIGGAGAPPLPPPPPPPQASRHSVEGNIFDDAPSEYVCELPEPPPPPPDLPPPPPPPFDCMPPPPPLPPPLPRDLGEALPPPPPPLPVPPPPPPPDANAEAYVDEPMPGPTMPTQFEWQQAHQPDWQQGWDHAQFEAHYAQQYAEYQQPEAMGDDQSTYEATRAASLAYQAAQDPAYKAYLIEHGLLPGGPGQVAAELQGPMTQAEKDRGLGSVFKRDDERLQAMREKDSREKDPNFISESYSECYPGYQEYATEVIEGSDDEEDLTKMDMGNKLKGRVHRWDFETEKEWNEYNETKEAMPKAAFQFGVKMADGRKTKKNSKDQKLNNQMNRINQLIKAKGKDRGDSGGGFGLEEIGGDGKEQRKRLKV
eukprot:jgi/Chlat1/6592/Chrsp46S06088